MNLEYTHAHKSRFQDDVYHYYQSRLIPGVIFFAISVLLCGFDTCLIDISSIGKVFSERRGKGVFLTKGTLSAMVEF